MQQTEEKEPVSDTPSGATSGPAVEWAVEAAATRVWEDDACELHVTVADEDFAGLRPRRVFPLSTKASYISFVDDRGVEKVLLRDPEHLDEASAGALQQALGRMYYVARIQCVHEVTEAMGVSLWDVDTDRGAATFEVSDRNRHIRILPHGRYLISDVDGNRFEIENIADLDAHSQMLVSTET